jgi:hypothetical protein
MYRRRTIPLCHQKISKQAMIARGYFLSDPAGENADNQQAKKADTGLHLNIGGGGWFEVVEPSSGYYTRKKSRVDASLQC